MRKNSLIAALEKGDRKVPELVEADPNLFPELMFGLWHEDGAVRSRAADAVEKVTRINPAFLQPFKEAILGVAGEARPAAVRWHIAQMIPRMKLTKKDKVRAMAVLQGYLSDRSSIVKTFAMDSLVQLEAPGMTTADIARLIEACAETGTPAMQARGRKLLAELKHA